MYLQANGGTPFPNALQDGTLVTDFLPIVSRQTVTAPDVYRQFILEAGIAPRNYFPFAESDGDLFFVDCGSADGTCYLYRHATAFDPWTEVGGMEAFWEGLAPPRCGDDDGDEG